jgi:hypothetical protein
VGGGLASARSTSRNSTNSIRTNGRTMFRLMSASFPRAVTPR